uniref:Phospholipase A2-like central domain-containing protein n=1 Tax=Gopherus agassizii TaxID=38772 RepID=A0A452IPH6_9SAUR
MNSLLIFAVFIAYVSMAHGSALVFNKMIKAATGKCAMFSYYRCYCGLGGKETALDVTERSSIILSSYRKHFSGQEPATTCSDQSQCRRVVYLCHRSTALCFQKILVIYSKSCQFYSNRQCKGSKARC